MPKFCSDFRVCRGTRRFRARRSVGCRVGVWGLNDKMCVRARRVVLVYRPAQLLRVKTQAKPLAWMVDYQAWDQYWRGGLAEKTLTATGWAYTHERLVRVRNSINKLISRGVMFTFCDPAWQQASLKHHTSGIIPKWADAIAWNELHHATPYNNTWD